MTHDRFTTLGPYFLIIIGLVTCGISAHFNWNSLDHLGGEVVASGMTLVTQQVRAVLNNKEGGTVNLTGAAPATTP